MGRIAAPAPHLEAPIEILAEAVADRVAAKVLERLPRPAPLPAPTPAPSAPAADQHPSRARLIRIKELSARVGMRTTAIYQRIKDGKFARQVKMGSLVAWVESEIDNWMQARADERG